MAHIDGRMISAKKAARAAPINSPMPAKMERPPDNVLSFVSFILPENAVIEQTIITTLKAKITS